MFRFIIVFILFSIWTAPKNLFGQVDYNQASFRADSLSTKNFDESIQLCNQLLEEVQPKSKWEGVIKGIRGKAYYFKGDFEIASKDYNEAIFILENLNEQESLGMVLINQARLYRKLKMFHQAHSVYGRAEMIFSALNQINHLATVWNEWGVVFELEKKYDSAIDYYQKSLKVKTQLNDSIGMAYSNGFLSTVYLLKEDYQSAELYGLKAIEYFKNLKDSFAIALQTSDMAAVYEKKKQYRLAIDFLNESDQIATAMRYLDLLSENYRKLSQLYAHQNQYKEAYQYHQKYAVLRDSLYNEKTQKNIAELHIQYETAQKDNQLLLHENKNVQQKFILSIVLALLLLTISFTLFIWKNKKLREEKLKQEAELQQELLKLENKNALQNDRLRISQDLHDNIGSNLTFILASLEDQSIDQDTNDVQHLVKDTISELRRTVWLINRPAVSIEEWILKLKDFYKRFQKVTIHSDLIQSTTILSSKQATLLFRILQEAVQNSIKHAQCNAIKINISQFDDQLNIEFIDDGIGFDINQKYQGYGLGNMQQNASALNGTLQIQSSLKQGTSLQLNIPLQNT